MRKEILSSERYKAEIFDRVIVDADIRYSQAVNIYGQTQELKADVYRPAGDTAVNRPVIFFMHGGAFFKGSRKDGYAVEFCRSFARRGYVTVSLQHRLGVENMYDPASYGDAIYRAVQDTRAALKFFCTRAADYGMDADRFFVGGGSAGAIAALHAAYWRHGDVPHYLETEKLGPLGEMTPVKGVLNLWGAVTDTALIRQGDVPVLNIHGEKDPIVPYKHSGMGIFNLYGSWSIHQAAQTKGTYSVLHAFPDVGHGLSRHDTVRWNTTVDIISDFLYKLVAEEPLAMRA